MTKRTYRVAEGVAWVNGQRVPDDRTVVLSRDEARFDLDHGRIAPVAADVDGSQPDVA